MRTKKQYEEYLNELTPNWDSLSWWMNGKLRRSWYHRNSRYGTALRKHDPIAFQVGYNEWNR